MVAYSRIPLKINKMVNSDFSSKIEESNNSDSSGINLNTIKQPRSFLVKMSLNFILTLMLTFLLGFLIGVGTIKIIDETPGVLNLMKKDETGPETAVVTLEYMPIPTQLAYDRAKSLVDALPEKNKNKKELVERLEKVQMEIQTIQQTENWKKAYKYTTEGNHM